MAFPGDGLLRGVGVIDEIDGIGPWGIEVCRVAVEAQDADDVGRVDDAAENADGSRAVDTHHAERGIAGDPLGSVANGHGRHAPEPVHAIVVSLAQALIGNMVARDVPVLCRPLVAFIDIPREEQAAGAGIVEHPLAYGCGILWGVFHHRHERPQGLDAVHQEGIAASVGGAALQPVHVVSAPLAGDDTPSCASCRTLTAVEDPVDEFVRVVVLALGGVEVSCCVDAQGQQSLVEAALLL